MDSVLVSERVGTLFSLFKVAQNGGSTCLQISMDKGYILTCQKAKCSTDVGSSPWCSKGFFFPPY